MSFWWVQPKASRPRKQKGDQARDLPYARDIKGILDRVQFSGEFATGGVLEVPHNQPPNVQVEGLGDLQWPLTAAQADQLKPLCQQAPHGRGEATVVDTSVRNTLQLSPDKFSIAQTSSWLTTLGKIVGDVQKELKVGGDVEAQLYKMLLYEKGSFFVPHRDTEKAPGMFGSLIVQLPGDHSGGDLVISHGGSTQSYGKPQLGGGLSYVAFYASCTHEVKPVTQGHRLCLVYNLVLPPQRARGGAAAAPDVSGYGPLTEQLGAAFTQWKQAKNPAERLVYMFEHRYTQKNRHGLASLKGADKLRAQLVEAAAQKAGGVGAAVVTVTKSKCGEADVPDWRSNEYYMGSMSWTHYTMEQLSDVTGDELYDDLMRSPVRHDEGMHGEGPGEELLDCILQDKPFSSVGGADEEHCDGPTGNEGCPMDEWYKHAALLLWKVDEEEDVEQEADQDVRSPAKQKQRR